MLPALVREFHEAKTKGAPQVELWGTRRARREFCHVDDCAAACLHLMDVYEDSQIITIGVGTDLTIGELAEAVRRVVGFQGDVSFDKSRPDGTPRKLVDVARIFSLGWRPAISLEEGIRATYQWHTEQLDD